MATSPSTSKTRPKERAVESYLESEVQAGESYFKSRFIADDLELSANEIGAVLYRLQQESDLLDIEQWSYTNGTTWRITFAEDREQNA
ncbi:MAG: hypothetical protein V5A55_05230 [Halovenus sp.]